MSRKVLHAFKSDWPDISDDDVSVGCDKRSVSTHDSMENIETPLTTKPASRKRPAPESLDAFRYDKPTKMAKLIPASTATTDWLSSKSSKLDETSKGGKGKAGTKKGTRSKADKSDSDDWSESEGEDGLAMAIQASMESSEWTSSTSNSKVAAVKSKQHAVSKQPRQRLKKRLVSHHSSDDELLASDDDTPVKPAPRKASMKSASVEPAGSSRETVTLLSDTDISAIEETPAAKKVVARSRLKQGKKLVQVAAAEEEEEEAEAADSDESNVSDSPPSDKSNDLEIVLRKTESMSDRIQALITSEILREGEVRGLEEGGVAVLAKDGLTPRKRKLVTQSELAALLPTGLELKAYQLVGVNWLWLLHRERINGILADEMGLGKTVQAVVFLAYVRHITSTTSPALIVVPGSTIGNWEREISIKAAVRYRCSGRDKFDVMITTYTLFERSSGSQAGQDRKFVCGFSFDYLVCDEAHSLRDVTSSRYRQLSRIQTAHKVMLTGTPVTGHLTELYALLCFTFPEVFSIENKSLSALFESGTAASAAAIGAAEFDKRSKQFERIRKILSPFILRREKSVVLSELVPKSTIFERLVMTPSQRMLYDELVAEWLHDKKVRVGISPVHIFSQLRKAANHPLLLLRHFKKHITVLARELHGWGVFGDECTIDMVREEISGYSDFQLHNYCLDYGRRSPVLKAMSLDEASLFSSAKMEYLRLKLPELQAAGHRVLLFSQFTTVLDIFESFLPVFGFQYLRLDGSTAIQERQALIDKFNATPEIFCFLLSSRAGGLGINLTAADVVILHDLDWNPAIDRQAEDRCHRIGQMKPVTVIKLLSLASVDEQIYKIAEEKILTSEDVLAENKSAESNIAKRILSEIS